MGITIGDSLAVVATLLGVGVTSWSIVVAVALLFPATAGAASQRVEASPMKSIGLGFLLTLTLGTIAVVLVQVPLPLIKLAGTILYLSLFAMAALGLAGLSLMASRRVRQLDSDVSPYRALVRSSGFIIAGGFLPLLGWFAFGPLIFFASLGAGAQVLMASSKKNVEVA